MMPKTNWHGRPTHELQLEFQGPKKPAFLWEWDFNGELQRTKLFLVLGGEVIKEYPWSKWVKFPTIIKNGYWEKK